MQGLRHSRIGRRGITTLLSVCFATMAACTQQNVKETQALAPGEGILVTVARCDGAISWMEFYESGKQSTGFAGGFNRAGVIACGKGPGRKSLLRTIRVRQGRYYIGSVGQVSTLQIPEAEALTFTVEANKLNYIGDLHVPLLDYKANTAFIDILVDDREAAAREALQAEYPALEQKYAWIRQLAVDPRR